MKQNIIKILFVAIACFIIANTLIASIGNNEDVCAVSAEIVEDENEAEKIAIAVEDQIGTDSELECFGYDATYVIRCLTAEAGDDAELCHALATCLLNTCVRFNGAYTPEEAIREYKWTSPSDFSTESATDAFTAVFVRGELHDGVGDATMFYNPKFTDGVPVHEQMQYVCTISDVRFFEED